MADEIEKIKNSILSYQLKNIQQYVQEALDAKIDPKVILEDGMVSAMKVIGDGFKENKIYMPQMLMAAKTMQQGLEVLKPHLVGTDSLSDSGKAIVGSVAGDVHDIGKNLVSIMLQGAGLEVIDLGADVLDSTFMDALKQNDGVKFVAASSSMTPTRESLRAVVKDIKNSEYKDKVVVMVGGATMDQLFSDEIGADIYTADAASAAQRAKEIVSGEDLSKVKAESKDVGMDNLAKLARTDETVAEKASAENLRHLMEAPIRKVGHRETKPLSVKDNFLETLKHEKGCPDRYVNQYEYFGIVVDPVISNSMAFDKIAPEKEYVDGWGVYNYMPAGAGGSHPEHGPGKTKITDITKWREQLSPPTVEFPESVWDSVCKPQQKAVEESGKFVAIWMASGIFERVHFHLGMQQALMAYYEHPEEMHELIDALTDWEIRSLDQTMSHIDAEVLFHHDDWGTAINSFLDYDTHRKFFLEPYKKVYKHFRELGGKYVVHHSDSYAANLVPIMIDMGADVWQGPIDANDIPKLIDQYGDKIVFMGGIDDGVVDTPDWNPAAVSKYVEEKCDQNGVVSYIPCLTRGLGESMFEGVYDHISKTIDEISKKKF